MKGIYEEIRKDTKASKNLRVLALDKKCDRTRADDLRKEQDKYYKRAEFFKGFCKAMDKVKDE